MLWCTPTVDFTQFHTAVSSGNQIEIWGCKFPHSTILLVEDVIVLKMTHPSAPTHSTGYLIEKTLSYQTSMLLWRLWRQLLSLSLKKQTAQNVLVVECEDKTGSGGWWWWWWCCRAHSHKQPPVYTIKLQKLCNLLNMPGQENEIEYWFRKHVTKSSGLLAAYLVVVQNKS